MELNKLFENKIVLNKDEYAALYGLYLAAKTFANLNRKEIKSLFGEETLIKAIQDYENRSN